MYLSQCVYLINYYNEYDSNFPNNNISDNFVHALYKYISQCIYMYLSQCVYLINYYNKYDSNFPNNNIFCLETSTCTLYMYMYVMYINICMFKINFIHVHVHLHVLLKFLCQCVIFSYM